MRGCTHASVQAAQESLRRGDKHNTIDLSLPDQLDIQATVSEQVPCSSRVRTSLDEPPLIAEDREMRLEFPGFPPEARQFLRDLSVNNNRDWFRSHKADYERHVREPLLALVEELGSALAEHSPGYLRDPRKSVYRIYRDVRFSKNKAPYKTHAAAVFPPLGLERHAGAGFYFHFSADALLIGGGVYAPGSNELRRIREQIAGDPAELRKILAAKPYRQAYAGLEGETLKRVPQGFPKDHPAADLLVRKQFLSGAQLSAEEIEKPTITALIDRHFRAIAPLLEYLNRPLRTF